MPLLFSLGQHGALQAAQEQLRPQERLMAFLDDVYMVSQAERVGSVCEGCLMVGSDHGPQAEVAQGVGPGPLVEL